VAQVEQVCVWLDSTVIIIPTLNLCSATNNVPLRKQVAHSSKISGVDEMTPVRDFQMNSQ